MAFGGACNIFMLMVANLVGFSSGIDGSMTLVSDFFRDVRLVLIVFYLFFSATQLMLMIREGEKIPGAKRRF